MLAWVSNLLLAIGMLGFLAGLAASVSEHPWLDRVELPLGDAQGVAVDAQGRIYVASRAYKRIQRYDASGTFDRGWHLGGGKGEVALAADALGGVTLSIAGIPIERIDAEDRRRAISSSAERPAPPAAGAAAAALRLEAGWLTPVRVLRADAGSELTVLRQGGLLWILRSPLPVWLIALAGLGLSFFRRGDGSPSRVASGSPTLT